MFVLVACSDNDSNSNGTEPNDSAMFSQTIDIATTTAEQLLDVFSINGLTIALVDAENDFTWTYGFGYADSENSVPVTEDTMFSIGSTSKAFTAIAVMQLVEQGLIDLDEALVTYLPEFSRLPHPIEGGNYENITVRMLLSHTAGIYPDFWGNHAFTIDDHDEGFLNDFLDALSNQTMVSEEGTVFAYANNGFNLLGILVATVSGYDDVFEGFVSYTNAHVFSPMGMDRSTFAMNDSMRPYLARPYLDATTQEELILYNGLPTGGMFSTAADMATFMQIVLNDGHFEDGQLLTRDSLAKMMGVHDFDFSHSMGGITYGLGFMQRMNLEGFSSVGHGGTLPHYHTDMIFDLESGIGVFVSVNTSTGVAAATMLADTILQSAVYEKIGALNLAPTMIDADAVPIDLSTDELQRYEGFYILMGGQKATVELTEDNALVFIQHSMPEMPLTLNPMSDGSFTNPLVGHLWFDEIDGEMTLFQTEFKILIGLRMNVESFLVNEEITSWFGTYEYKPESDRSAPIITHIEIGIDEFDIAVAEIFMPHMNQTTPLFQVDGVWYFGGSRLDVTLEDDIASFEVQGVRFERNLR